MITDGHRWREKAGRADGGFESGGFIRVHQHSSVAKRFLCVLCVPLCALCVLPSCNSIPTGLADKPVGTYDRPYPRHLAQTEVLDIQVIRNPETVISLTNTTSRTFGPSTIWINGRYSRPILGLAPGETLRLNLYEFRDEFGEKFRAGGFFATKLPDEVVHAQLETIENGETKLLGLVVVGQEE